VGCLLAVAALCGAAWGQASDKAADTGSALPYRIHWGVKIPLRDGVLLDATVFRPVSDKPVPVVLTLTPYTADRFEDVGAYFAAHGYAFASVDDRGRGNSAGKFVLWQGEGVDGHDVVEWLAKQSWTDGQVAMWGGSYGGKNQWMIAGEAPHGLKTIAPASAGIAGQNIGMNEGNLFLGLDMNWLLTMMGHTANNNGGLDQAYWKGVYEEAGNGLVPYRDLDTLAGWPNAMWQEWMRHPARDAYWDAASTAEAKYARMTLPTLSITGEYDTSETGTLEFRQKQLDAVKGVESYLVVGPWDHPGSRVPKQRLGGLDFSPAAVLDVKALHVAWYDHVMKGGPLPAFLKDRVVYFVTGSNRWETAPTLEAATGRVETLFLSSAGTSAGSVAQHGELVVKAEAQSADSYVYDPSLPGRNEGFEGGEMVTANYLTDAGLMRRIDGDGLVYDTAAMDAPSDLVGIPKITLMLSMDVPDTDIRAALYEVKADGSVVFLAQDLVRARYRKSLRQEELVKPGVVEAYKFEHFNFVARTLAKGSVLRLVIVPQGASFQGERNRNSGKPVADETAADNRVAHVSVALGPGMSHVELPWGR
jgi:putative CocE/NonD family hydrolase